MANVIVRRVPPFKRGMMSIQLIVNGVRAATIWNDQPCTIELSPGRHQIIAKKNGVRGKVFEIDISDDLETRELLLHDVEITQHLGFIILFVLITAIPDDLLGGLTVLWIKFAIYAVGSFALGWTIRTSMRKNLLLTEKKPELFQVTTGDPSPI